MSLQTLPDHSWLQKWFLCCSLLFLTATSLFSQDKRIFQLGQRLANYGSTSLYADEVTISEESIVLTLYFYNSSSYSSTTVMLTSVTADRIEPVEVEGLSIAVALPLRPRQKKLFEIETSTSSNLVTINIDTDGWFESISLILRENPGSYYGYSALNISAHMREWEAQRLESLKKSITASVLSTWRFEFFENPGSLDQFIKSVADTVSMTLEKKPFLTNNEVLKESLYANAQSYYLSPSRFSSIRLQQLDIISREVLRRPFLIRNDSLRIWLEADQDRFESNPNSFSDDRLEELNEISQTVLSRNFVMPPSIWTTVGIVALILGLLTTIALSVLKTITVRDAHTVRQPPEVEGQIPSPEADREHSVDWALVVLEVGPNATNSEIETAYKCLIKKYHPDKVHYLGREFIVVAEQKAREINAAYQILCARKRDLHTS